MEYNPAGLPARYLAVSRAPREAVAIQGAVAQLEGFSHESEHDRVLARRVGDPQGMDTDLPLGTAIVLSRDEPARCDPPPGELRQAQGRAARRILLGSMMPLNDLDVGRPSQGPRGLAHEFHQEIDRPARVGRDQKRDAGGSRLQRRALRRVEAGGPDHERHTPLLTPLTDRQGGPWRGEVDHDVHRRLGGVRPAQRDTHRGDPDERPGILSKPRMTVPLQRRGQRQRGVFRDQLDQSRTHPSQSTIYTDRDLCL